MKEMFEVISDDVIKIVLLLGLSFLIGLEREEEKHTRAKGYFFGGVRTYPLVAFIGFLLVLLSPENMMLFAVGFFVIGLFLVVSYWTKISQEEHGITSEMAGLITYLIGGAIAKDLYWIAVTVGIINVLLLQMKTYLEGMAKRIAAHEITTLVKFLLLSAVILPVIPNQTFTVFNVNPYKTWLIIVAVSSISYGSYLMEKLLKVKQSTFLSAIFGGLYSSTATTVVLAKQAKDSKQSYLYSGAIMLASSMMYLRMAVLIFFFNREIFFVLGDFFIQLAAVSALLGAVWSKFGTRKSESVRPEIALGVRNPLELKTAFVFASLFILVLILTNIAIKYFGKSGVFSLAALAGTIDVDPFILGLAQTGGALTTAKIASAAIIIASASNNIAKGVYTLIIADRKTGFQALALLAIVSLVSFSFFLWA
ncbi:MAG: MgtC/SapB family protein [Candidatus Omnitrophica bacterium]|nr:MgtC/SapB family protein [Candidatus Omnitrophota bacterium]